MLNPRTPKTQTEISRPASLQVPTAATHKTATPLAAFFFLSSFYILFFFSKKNIFCVFFFFCLAFETTFSFQVSSFTARVWDAPYRCCMQTARLWTCCCVVPKDFIDRIKGHFLFALPHQTDFSSPIFFEFEVPQSTARTFNYEHQDATFFQAWSQAVAPRTCVGMSQCLFSFGTSQWGLQEFSHNGIC